MDYKNYIWDLGGTLLDNYESSSHAFAAALWETAERVVMHEEVYQALKISTEHAVETYASDVPGFLAVYKRLEAETLEQPILFKGAKEVLEAVKTAGGKNFMISHRNRQVLDILKKSGISEFFTEVVTSDNGFPRKPDPSSLNYLLDKYQLLPAETVVIGDRSLDIEAGVAAGIDGIFFDAESSHPQAKSNIKDLKALL
ncbi:HAD family hydrolase [Lactococcus termiticola]|uniref:Phosphoglycolate phosphatase haloacid dehalogenase hydrolase n=1 Tax=Lactococcus termiticola TaxID=2169526 RepID=A0A2R5HIW8_9LACT|nr:HAD family hydrolase [Lactococcus termiticola]GBG96340.1 phosphoglycolate phosphatase haloacid dehalogenase hydrolase [Lactococcus termiticola]